MKDTPPFVPLDFIEYPAKQMQQQAEDFYLNIKRRRTVREFSERPIPEGVLEHAILAAGTAPSGANMQPWHFVVIQNSEIKSEIRQAAEAEEVEFYTRRASEEWLDALKPFGTDAQKPFLETAPALIAIFEQKWHEIEGDHSDEPKRVKHYYPTESVGLATGMLVTALHHAGLATLTHTPSPMKFLNKILNRPSNERPFLLLVVGYPADGTEVPDITKKCLDEIATFI